jgi:penicillin-binding protein 1A
MSPRRPPRKEPRFETQSPSQKGELRVSKADRAGGTSISRATSSKNTSSKKTRAKKRGWGLFSSTSRARKPRRSLLGRLVYWVFIAGIWAGIGVAGLIIYHASQLPSIDKLAVPKRPPNIAILAEDGSLIANRGDTGGRAISLKEVPAYLPNAFIAIEDRRFRAHYGIDPIGIARALVRNLTSRGVSQGGSTLTQQLAKNLFLTQERTASRKIQEAILALWLERTYTKDQLLELYLNRVYFGSGAYGVEAAAQRYFDKSARAVTLPEAAMLAGLVQAPSRLAPNRNPEGAKARSALVISAMVDTGFIKPELAKIALLTPAEAAKNTGAGSIQYAADYVMDILDDVIGTVESDISVTTTLSPKLQQLAEKSLIEELEQKGAKFNVEQGAFVAMSPEGSIRALVGGRNYSESQFNRATSAKRQPGSAFKPFVYLTALEKGLTPDTIREDTPITIKGWTPENYSREYRGPVRLSEALAMSLNTVAVKLAVEVSPKAVVRTAQRLGINSPLQANVSLALGTSEVTPLELTSAYAPFANGGLGVTPHIIAAVKTADGKALFQYKAPSSGRVVPASTIAQLNGMMRDTLLIGTAKKADFTGWEAGGKTGTTQDFRDAWFVGYTGHLIAGVWLGNDDSSATKKVTGSNLPVEIWSRFMRGAHQGVPPISLPGGPFFGGRPSSDVATDPATGLDSSRPNGQVRPKRPSSPADDNDMTDRAWTPPDPKEKSLFEKLFQ